MTARRSAAVIVVLRRSWIGSNQLVEQVLSGRDQFKEATLTLRGRASGGAHRQCTRLRTVNTECCEV